MKTITRRLLDSLIETLGGNAYDSLGLVVFGLRRKGEINSLQQQIFELRKDVSFLSLKAGYRKAEEGEWIKIKK